MNLLFSYISINDLVAKFSWLCSHIALIDLKHRTFLPLLCQTITLTWFSNYLSDDSLFDDNYPPLVSCVSLRCCCSLSVHFLLFIYIYIYIQIFLILILTSIYFVVPGAVDVQSSLWHVGAFFVFSCGVWNL